MRARAVYMQHAHFKRVCHIGHPEEEQLEGGSAVAATTVADMTSGKSGGNAVKLTRRQSITGSLTQKLTKPKQGKEDSLRSPVDDIYQAVQGSAFAGDPRRDCRCLGGVSGRCSAWRRREPCQAGRACCSARRP